MKHTLKICTMLLLAISLISLNSIATAQNKNGKNKEEAKDVIIEKKIITHDDDENYHRGKNGMGIKGLTDEQKQKIKALKLSQKKEMMLAKNLINEKQAHLKTLETADNVDMNAINKTIDEIGSLKTDLLKKKAAHKQEIRKILNDEQRLQFDLKHSRNERNGMKNKKMHKKRKGHPGMEMEKNIDIKIFHDDDEEGND